MSPETINAINAASTVVVALATVALTVVAVVQIRHRNEDKAEQQSRLRAVAKHHGLLVQRALIDAVTASGRVASALQAPRNLERSGSNGASLLGQSETRA